MAKDRLFELVREEDVVLFIGAGFSIYAGYPSGSGLAKYIYGKLSKSEQEDVEFTYDLSRLTEEIYHLKNQNNNFILKCIKEVFSKPPKATSTHELLGKIPQFKTTITTNYDSLIENNNSDLEVIRESKDIPLAHKHKPKLYKIHGDLTNLDKTILKTSDYDNYFIKNSEQTVFWNEIKAVLAKHHILFIGYSLEDSNIKTIIDRIFNELRDTKKEAFFISPNLKKSKKNYLNSKGIRYIKSTGEEFIKELTEDLKLNYYPHIQSKGGSADTAMIFGEKYDFNSAWSKMTGKPNLVLKNPFLFNKYNSINSRIKFIPKSDKGITRQIKDFSKGRSKTLKFTKDQLKRFDVFLGELRIGNIETIEEVEILRKPVFREKVTFVFEDDYESDELLLEIISYMPEESIGVFEFQLFDFDVKVRFDFIDNQDVLFNLTFNARSKISSIRNAIQFYEIINRLLNNMKLRLFGNTKEIKLLPFLKNIPIKDDEFLKMNQQALQYFQSLKKIERHYGFRFSDIDMNNINNRRVECVMAFINNTVIALKKEIQSLTCGNEKDKQEILKFKKDEKLCFIFNDKEETVIELHGRRIKIGYKSTYFTNAIIQNFEELKSNKTDKIKLKIALKKSYIQFTKEPLTFNFTTKK